MPQYLIFFDLANQITDWLHWALYVLYLDCLSQDHAFQLVCRWERKTFVSQYSDLLVENDFISLDLINLNSDSFLFQSVDQCLLSNIWLAKDTHDYVLLRLVLLTCFLGNSFKSLDQVNHSNCLHLWFIFIFHLNVIAELFVLLLSYESRLESYARMLLR